VKAREWVAPADIDQQQLRPRPATIHSLVDFIERYQVVLLLDFARERQRRVIRILLKDRVGGTEEESRQTWLDCVSINLRFLDQFERHRSTGQRDEQNVIWSQIGIVEDRIELRAYGIRPWMKFVPLANLSRQRSEQRHLLIATLQHIGQQQGVVLGIGQLFQPLPWPVGRHADNDGHPLDVVPPRGCG
jgi:hypothetical protein